MPAENEAKYPRLQVNKEVEFKHVHPRPTPNAYERYVAEHLSADEVRVPVLADDTWRKIEVELGRVNVECTSHNSADGQPITVTAPMCVELSFARKGSPAGVEAPPPPSAVRYRLERDALVVTLAYPDGTLSVITIDIRDEALRSDHATNVRLRFPICYSLQPRITAYQALRSAACGGLS